MRNIRFLFSFVCILLISSCTNDKNTDDLVLYNAQIFDGFEMIQADAIGVKDGEISRIGNSDDLLSNKNAETEYVDVQKAFLMPGFIEGHGHFSGLGSSLQNLNFLKVKNWQEILSMVNEAGSKAEKGAWIEGRGWHQEKWDTLPELNFEGYPTHDNLSSITPDNPVILIHASGHSLFANEKAMQLAGVSKDYTDPVGGRIVRNDEGEAIGVFEETAMDIIKEAYQEYLNSLSQEALAEKWHEAIELAQEECLKKGITSFQDAGSKFYELERYQALAENGKLDLRLWTMVRHSSEEMDGELAKYKMVGVGDNFYTCNAIKSEVDGALGAFGAWLLASYSDKADFNGQNTTDVKEVQAIADLALKNDMQFCVHAIGDRANSVVLDIFEAKFKEKEIEENLRWRIEHAQHLDPKDFERFKSLNVIASMQAVHCTSDAPFVVKRLGEKRAREGAYAWRSLIDAGVVVTNGTDAPVEDVDPLRSYYAAVTRKRADNQMEFFTEQSMTREEGLTSYTYNNAYAAFEEDLKGSIKVGKLADITILDTNLISCEEDQILNSKVLHTIVNGEIKYSYSNGD